MQRTRAWRHLETSHRVMPRPSPFWLKHVDLWMLPGRRASVQCVRSSRCFEIPWSFEWPGKPHNEPVCTWKGDDQVWFIYVLRCEDDCYYAGGCVAGKVEARIELEFKQSTVLII